MRLKAQFGGAALEAQSIGDVAEAVGRIATEELGKMGEFSENVSTKIQRLGAEWDNFKVSVGGTGNEVGLVADGIDLLTDSLKNLGTFLEGSGGQALSKWLKLVFIVPRYTLKAGNSVLELVNDMQTLQHAVEEFNNDFKDIPFIDKGSFNQETNGALSQLEKQAEAAGKKLLILSDATGKFQISIKNAPVVTVAAATATEALTNNYDDLQAKLKDLMREYNVTELEVRL